MSGQHCNPTRYIYRQQQQNHVFQCVCVCVRWLHIQWDSNTHQCILYIHTSPLGIQLSWIQRHNRRAGSSKHTQVSYFERRLLLLSQMYLPEFILQGLVLDPMSDFPQGSQHRPPAFFLRCFWLVYIVLDFYVNVQPCIQSKKKGNAPIIIKMTFKLDSAVSKKRLIKMSQFRNLNDIKLYFIPPLISSISALFRFKSGVSFGFALVNQIKPLFIKLWPIWESQIEILTI